MNGPVFDDSHISELSHQVCHARRTAEGVELVFGDARPSTSVEGALFSQAAIRFLLSETTARQLLQALEKCSAQIIQ
jgi:hypothetical protein